MIRSQERMQKNFKRELIQTLSFVAHIFYACFGDSRSTDSERKCDDGDTNEKQLKIIKKVSMV
jgi:hypothetical protein